MWASGPVNVHEKRPASGKLHCKKKCWTPFLILIIVPIFKGDAFEFRGINHMISVAQTDDLV